MIKLFRISKPWYDKVFLPIHPRRPRIRMNDESAPRALLRYIAKHNRQALLLTFLSLVSAALLWGLLYVLTFWFAMVTVTVTRSFNPDTLLQITEPKLLGPYFAAEFLAGASVVLLVAWVIRRHMRTEKVREARQYLLWLFLELFMAVPNVTFSIWGNLSAMVRLRRRETAEAWHLLQRMKEHGGRISMTSLRTEIEDEKTLGRVLVALQLIELVGIRENDDGWFLYLQNLESFPALQQPPQQSMVGTPEEET
jgi:hypothetical protein